MANTRLRKPLHDLTQTAFDLARYLRHVDPKDFLKLMNLVLGPYKAPKESYIWTIFYSRKRVEELKEIIKKFEAAIEIGNADVIKTGLEIFQKEASGWDDTSVNTNLLRLLLKELHGYDSEAKLEINEIIELYGLLLEAIEKRLEAEARLSEEEARLKEIDDEKFELELQLLKTQQELLRKQEEILDKESRLQELKETESTKDSELRKIEAEKTAKIAELTAYEARLSAIQIERNKREEELDAARAKLLLLNPEIDISKMGLKEIETLMTEAKQVGEEAARTYIKEVQEVRKRREELGNLKGNFSKVKKNLAGKAVYGAEVPIAEAANLSEEQARVVKEKEARTQEMQALCNKRNKDKDRVVKSYMERFLKMQIEQKTKKDQEAQSKTDEHASVESLYSEGERAIIVDKAALERVNARRPFSEMKIAPPKSLKPEFLHLVDHLKTHLQPRAVEAPKQQPPVEAKKVDAGKREQLERMLAFNPDLSPAMTKTGVTTIVESKENQLNTTTQPANITSAGMLSTPLITRVLAIKDKLNQPLATPDVSSLPPLPASPEFPPLPTRAAPPIPPPPPKFASNRHAGSMFAGTAQAANSGVKSLQADAVSASPRPIKVNA